jgi:ketosteroid isomerase-like protein
MTGTSRVRAYYEALNAGDAAPVSSHFTEDATHYYTRLGPHEGAKAIGDMAALGVSAIDAQWYVENAIEQGDQVAIEWTMTWRDPQSGDKRLEGRGYRMLADWEAPTNKEAA